MVARASAAELDEADVAGEDVHLDSRLSVGGVVAAAESEAAHAEQTALKIEVEELDEIAMVLQIAVVEFVSA